MKNAAVVRDDDIRGSIVDDADAARVIVEFEDGSRLAVERDSLVRENDGTYRLARDAGEIVIPVVAEELTVETHQVVRGRVRVTKRIESKEEVVDAPSTRDEVVVERIAVNAFVEGDAPTVRDENGVLIIPVIEEVTVSEKRLLIREEVRISRRRTTTNHPQTVVLRREVVDVEQDEFDGPAAPPIKSPAK